MRKALKPGLVFQPETHRQFVVGTNLIINAIRPTLGPVPRTVLIDKIGGKNKPGEILDNGATIARRLIQLPERGHDMGAMFVRQMLCTLGENTVEGTATAAVLFQSIFNQGMRYVEDGGNPMLLRKCLEELVPPMLEEINSQSVCVLGEKQLSALAETICHDPSLAKVLGEIFHIIGEYGRLEIHSSNRYELERTYTEGSYWDGALSSRAFIEDIKLGCTIFENAAVLVTDLDINEPIELVPVVSQALNLGIKQLVILARNISDRALGLLLSTENRKNLCVIVVKTPGAEVETQRDAITDVAFLTGATPLATASGDLISKVTAQHFGYARRILFTANNFCVVGGRGDARALRDHINILHKRLAISQRYKYQNHQSEQKVQQQLLTRIGTLMGGTATLVIGDFTLDGIEARKLLAERTSEAIRGSLKKGVVAGGGVCLFRCEGLLRRRLAVASTDEERAACQIMIKAIESPMHTLLRNAGVEALEWIPRIRSSGFNFGFDVLRREIVDMMANCIYDSSAVIQNAVQYATHSAALALTIDVLVYRKRPPETYGST